MPVDPYLARLVDAAEAGKPVPPVRVFAGSSAAVGQPTTTAEFIEVSELALRESLAPSRWNRKAGIDPTEAARERMASWSGPGQDSGPVLSLINCQWYSIGGGSGFDLPVMRIPLEKVDAWWIAGGKEMKERGGFIVGAFFPIPGAE